MHSDDDVMLFSGSANFTRSALNEIPPIGNYEIGLLGKVELNTTNDILRPIGKKSNKG